jgi:hypothetical protein
MKTESKTGIPKTVNRVVGGVYNAVRLSSASRIERTIYDGRGDSSTAVDLMQRRAISVRRNRMRTDV